MVDTIQRRSRTVFHHGGLPVRRGMAERESIISEFRGQDTREIRIPMKKRVKRDW